VETVETIFFFSALVGGTILVCQFVLTVVGLGSEFDYSDGVLHDAGSAADSHHGPDHQVGHDEWTSWLFSVISFRTVIAALTFFGLAGMAGLRSGLGSFVSLSAAVLAGGGAMMGVHWMVSTLSRLRTDGTMRIARTVGARGSVYIPVPPKNEGQGKVQLKLNDRIVELRAQTSAEQRLPTGAMVVVTDVLGQDTVSVEPIEELLS
jgi:hypothetical protein